jgi:hypothetical protein
MSKKNPKKDSKIIIPKRAAGKAVKTDYMKNLRRFPSLHPVDDLLGFSDAPTDKGLLDARTDSNLGAQTTDDLGTQNSTSLDAPTGNPLDAQNTENPDAQNIESLDAQTIKTPDAQNLDVWTPKKENSGRPKKTNLDAQAGDTWTSKETEPGRPNEKFLDVRAPKEEIRTPKKADNLGVQQSKEKSSGAQKGEKPIDWRKYEKTRATARISLRPNAEILRKFKVFCVEQNLTMSDFFELAGLKYIETLDAQNAENLGVRTPIDDRRLKMLYKTRPFIINLYLAYNAVFNELAGGSGSKSKWSGRWTPRDDEAARRYNDVNPAIVELGIIQTQTNKGIGQGRIQTFKYYVEEIDKVLASGVSDEMLDTILKYHRQIWNNLTKREVDLSFLEEKPEEKE